MRQSDNFYWHFSVFCGMAKYVDTQKEALAKVQKIPSPLAGEVCREICKEHIGVGPWYGSDQLLRIKPHCCGQLYPGRLAELIFSVFHLGECGLSDPGLFCYVLLSEAKIFTPGTQIGYLLVDVSRYHGVRYATAFRYPLPCCLDRLGLLGMLAGVVNEGEHHEGGQAALVDGLDSSRFDHRVFSPLLCE